MTPAWQKNNCQSDGALTKHDVRICKVSCTSPAKTYHTPPKLKRFWCMSTSMPSIFKEAKLLRLQVNSKPFFLSRKRACCVGLASNEVLGGCLFHWGRFIDVWSKTFQRKVLLLPYRGGQEQLDFFSWNVLIMRMNGGSDWTTLVFILVILRQTKVLQ